jgi:hypothetical protein
VFPDWLFPGSVGIDVIIVVDRSHSNLSLVHPR